MEMDVFRFESSQRDTLHGEWTKEQGNRGVYYRALLPALRARLFRPITDPMVFPGFGGSSSNRTTLTGLAWLVDTRRFLDGGSSVLLGPGFRGLCGWDYKM